MGAIRSIVPDRSRRQVLAALGLGVAWCVGARPAIAALRPPTPGRATRALANLAVRAAQDGLGDADANGVRLPPGFVSRIVARAGEPPLSDAPPWPIYPDGGACFATADGGFVYVANSEVDAGAGGVASLRFDADGALIEARTLLAGTSRNCAGGPTPWGTWLSCEEIDRGRVYECDPLARFAPQPLPALGRFRHEAAACDPQRGVVYLSEDEPDGRFYRFRAASWPSLNEGTLEVARLAAGDLHQGVAVEWLPVPDPAGDPLRTRTQVPASHAFDGGEGLWWRDDAVFLATKGDDRIWRYDVPTATLRLVYDGAGVIDPVLTGVDNLVAAADGTLYVAEDAGDMQIVALHPDGRTQPILQVVGHPGSEIAGPAFSPDGRCLLFNSQRGPALHGPYGVTLRIDGPFAADRFLGDGFEPPP